MREKWFTSLACTSTSLLKKPLKPLQVRAAYHQVQLPLKVCMLGAGLVISGRIAWRNGSSIRLDAEGKKELIRKLLFYWARPTLRRNGIARITRPAAFTNHKKHDGYNWRGNGGGNLGINRQACFFTAFSHIEQEADQVIS